MVCRFFSTHKMFTKSMSFRIRRAFLLLGFGSLGGMVTPSPGSGPAQERGPNCGVLFWDRCCSLCRPMSF